VANHDIPALVARLNSLYRRAVEMFDESLARKLSNVGTKTDERALGYWVDDARKDATIGLDALAIRDAAAALSRLTRERDEALAREQADKDAWALYLKVGETPLERLAREIADNHAVCAVLAHRTRERDEAREALADVKGMGAWRKWDE
jgi:hypothetical protein